MPDLSAIPAKIIALIIAGIVAVLVIWAAFHFWNLSRSQAAQGRVGTSQAAAASNSAADAVNTVAASGEASAASEALTRENERNIRAAPGANVVVSNEVDAAGRAALCRRAAYANDPSCKGAK